MTPEEIARTAPLWPQVHRQRPTELIKGATEWQPIDTAPKDTAECVWGHWYCWRSDTMYSDTMICVDGQWTDSHSDEPIQPTYWMPLPAPPSD